MWFPVARRWHIQRTSANRSARSGVDRSEGGILSSQNQDDAELLACVANQDAEALAQLYDRYSAAVFSLCLRIVRDRASAEEVTQEVFVRLWRSAGTFSEERGRASTWLLRIAHNLALNEVRRRQSRPVTVPENEDHPETAQVPDTSIDGDPAAAAWLREQASAVRDALAQLPQPQRQAIEMAFFGGLTQAEISAALGDPLGTVKSRIRAGMARLRELLLAAGVDGQG